MKKNDIDEKWYARMDEIEAVSQTRIAETRIEYLDTFIRVIKKRYKSKHEIQRADSHQVQD